MCFLFDRLLSQKVRWLGDLHSCHRYRRVFSRAIDGDGAAAFEIANAYYGQWFEPSSDEAHYRWCLEAARLGHAEAMVDVARGNMFGIGVRKNRRTAWKHLVAALQSADEGARRLARVLMAASFLHGWGCPRNARLGLRQLRTEADHGSIAAAEILGEEFLEGTVVRKNYKKAARWLEIGARANTPSSARRLAELYEFGRGVKRSAKTAMSWMKRAAVGGDLEARHLLGLYYQDGVGTRPDRAKAIRWYLKSWKFRNPSSAFNLGLVYWCSGASARRTAWKWFRLAAQHGHRTSLRFVETRNESLIQQYLPYPVDTAR